jgi:hypothetical protein
MRPTLPREGLDEIILYIRTYNTLLRTTGEVQIRSLEETHKGMRSLLHPDADDSAVDVSAFIYASLRLPPCILDVRLVILGQSQEVFRRRGYPDVESWQSVTAPARRRRMFYDGEEQLAAYIASISDIDDIIPMLTAFQIEWNKMHTRIALQAGLTARLQAWAEHPGAKSPKKLMKETRKVLKLSKKAWRRLRRVWGGDFPALIAHIARGHKRLAVSELAGSYIEYRRATQHWWNRVNRLGPFDISARLTHFVSSNNHSLVNMLSGFAQQHEARLMAYLEHEADADLKEEAARIRQREVPSDWNNFLYYILKKYLNSPQGENLLKAREVYEAAHGVTRIPSQHTFDLEVQVIELARLIPEDIDPRLRDLPLKRLRESEAVILNIDYPLGFAAYHLLTRLAVNIGELRSAYVIGKAATLNGRVGDVLIPNVVYDEHSGNTYLFGNVFTAQDVAPYIVYGDVLDNQRAISVRGTFLQNRPYVEGFLNRGYTDVEMEAGPYLSALYEFIRNRRYPRREIVNLYPVPFEIGILHYASDRPISRGKNLGAGNLSYYGMDPTYAATVAVLRRILTLETL